MVRKRKSSLIINADKIEIDPKRKAEFVGGGELTDEKRKEANKINAHLESLMQRVESEGRRSEVPPPGAKNIPVGEGK